jgi:hypothetical protein
MRRLWIGPCLLAGLSAGCGRNAEEPPPGPTPKTEVITKPDGTTEYRSSRVRIDDTTTTAIARKGVRATQLRRAVPRRGDKT